MYLEPNNPSLSFADFLDAAIRDKAETKPFSRLRSSLTSVIVYHLPFLLFLISLSLLSHLNRIHTVKADRYRVADNSESIEIYDFIKGKLIEVDVRAVILNIHRRTEIQIIVWLCEFKVKAAIVNNTRCAHYLLGSDP